MKVQKQRGKRVRELSLQEECPEKNKEMKGEGENTGNEKLGTYNE